MREKLTEYIIVADEKKVSALYTLLEDEVELDYEQWEDKAIVAELNDRETKMNSGEEKSYISKEAKMYLQM